MTPPKDTTPNPSQDELREEILTEFRNVLRLAPTDYTENCTNVVMSLIDAHTEEKVREATWPPLDLNAYENQLYAQISDIDAFNLFIKKWCPHASHLLDSDDNDGEYMRNRIKALTNKGKDTTQTMPSLDNQEVRGDK